MDIVIGLIVLLLSAIVATMGLRLWFWMLPILGAMIGFFLGAILVANIAGDGILATALSWIVGIVVGIAFALTSWFLWYTGAIIAAGATGALLATAIAASFGAESQWAFLIASVVGTTLFVLGALLFALPLYVVVVNTAIAGGVGVVSGLLLIVERIDVNDLGSGLSVAIINHSLGWWLLWIAVAIAGIFIQLRYTAIIALPPDRYVPTNRAIQ